MRRVLCVVLALVPVVLFAQAAPAPTPAAPAAATRAGLNTDSAPRTEPLRLGFSIERLGRIDKLLQGYVDDGRLAGAVALVLKDGQPVYEKAVGWSDKEANRPMTSETIFRIASQTKAITSVAVLALVEEGKVGINDPVSR